ncbi:GDSL-like Lipase/Acylhydrolase [Musa troglodytarum]|uniref:GDSL-like Lipase/Acylhydrolase n=1 Tax=Musa troglodytarum TaxID=320322 RepID=A0A9E7KJM3_9LILI|nr:GDSL-like Lipase/Acylhydrolase [Musa troglodytarum]URE18589.1 GDSL-like Lipase/Acylhydrolase [Musa troglodytarum]
MAPTSPLFFFLLVFFPSPSLQERRSRTSSGVLVASSSPSPPSPSASPLVPALFVLGDSTVDSGTNNYLGTLARADRPPYGRDFDTHRPTGRFSNGRIIVDCLAIRLGLPFVPPFLGWSGKIEDMIRGVNYASAASGILFSSGSDLIQQVSDTFQQFELSLGEEATADLISKSVFYVSIGSNDFIHYYLQNTSSAQVLFLPWEFNQLLVTTMKQALKSLYDKNVRRVVLTGLAPIGCTPHYLWLYASENGECVDAINNVVMEFNYAVRYMVHELNHELPNAAFTFCGFQTVTDACCGLGKYGGFIMCLLPEMACSNASTHVWWDKFHPTDAVNRIIADDRWASEHASMCYPVNLQDMIRSFHSLAGYTGW